MTTDTGVDKRSFSELLRAKLAAGDLPVLYPFAPTVIIGIGGETRTTLAKEQRALSEALQEVGPAWRRSLRQAAALAELRVARPPRRRAEALPPNLPPLGLALEEVAAFVGISKQVQRA